MNKALTPSDGMLALCRVDLAFFFRCVFPIISPAQEYIHAPYLEAIAYELTLIFLGEARRSIVNVPPRHGKSLLVSVAYVAWTLGRDPTKRIMVVSHTDKLCVDLSNTTRLLMGHPLYQAIFPGTQISPDKNTEDLFKTKAQGYRYGVPMGGAVTGFGADILIIDDLVKQEDAYSDVKRAKANEYFSSTLLSRLNDKKKGAIAIVMQRQHPQDLTGYVLEKGNWRQLSLQAIATKAEKFQTGPNSYWQRSPGDLLNPEREDKATLDNFRKEQGEHFFAAQYQQLPVLPGGNMIKLEWFKRYKTPPPLHHCEGYVQSWDPAVTAAETSSYSVCTTWLKAGNLYWLVDVFRMKLDYPDLEKAVAMLYRKYKPILIVIESSHIGWALYAKYRPHLGPVVRTMTPRGSKEERAAKQSAKISAGRVFLPTEAPYLKVYEDEIQQFPKAAYDDQVDSTTQFLGALDYPIPGVTV